MIIQPGMHADRGAWLSRSLAAGFIAVSAMTLVTMGMVAAVVLFGGSSSFALIETLIERSSVPAAMMLIIHFAFGLAWAVVYGAFFADRVSGPAWRRGLMFAAIPFVLSLVAFYPMIGAGVLGIDMGLGSIPLLASMVAHAVFGIVLGSIYALPDVESNHWFTEQQNTDAEHRSSIGAQNGIAIGLVAGIAVGIVIAFATGMLSMGAAPSMFLLFSIASLCAALGVWLGSVVGLTRS